MISQQIVLIGQSLEFLTFLFFEVLLKLSFGLLLVASLALHQVVVHVGVLVNADINCLVEEDLHLLLKESVELCFELLFLLLGLQALMVNLLVVFLNSQSVDGLLELRSDFSVVGAFIQVDQELFSSLFSQFSLLWRMECVILRLDRGGAALDS
jgi:hypothetical protein